LLRPLGIRNPNFIAATGDESKLLISSIPGNWNPGEQNAVYIVDPLTDTISGILGATGTGSDHPRGSFSDPDRDELYLSWAPTASRVFDSELNLLRQCGAGGSVVAAGKIYLPDAGHIQHLSIAVFDALTCQYLRSIPQPGHGGYAVRTRAGDKVCVLTTASPDLVNPNPVGSNAVVVIDTATDQVSVFPLNRLLNFGSLVLSPDETQVYLAMDVVGAGGRLGVLDL
jgi:DNA-binding beta-propeller fold protein YncE